MSQLQHPVTSSAAPSVLVVMAVFNPQPDHLRAQLASLVAQSVGAPALLAVIADTRSGALLQSLADETGLTATLVEPNTEMDAVTAFECGLLEALAWVDRVQTSDTALPLIALCDQDDVWHTDRLACGIDKMAKTGAALVHSDARLIDHAGQELHPSMFAFERRHKNPGPRGLLLRNNITGMTILMRSDVLRIALPLPPQSGVHFYHDLWLGLVAHMLKGGVALIRTPLVDYRQHETNAIGAVDRQSASPKRHRLPDAMWLRREAASYALARYLAQSLRTRITETLPDALPRLRPLWPFLRHARGASFHIWDSLRLLLTGHAGLARIAAGFALVNAGRLIWALREALKTGLNQSIQDLDAKLYSLSPGVAPRVLAVEQVHSSRPLALSGVIDRRKTPRWTPVFDARGPALVILVPTLNPSEIFAGIVTALDIGVKLAESGLNVRFVATDLPVFSHGASRQFLLQRLSHGGANTDVSTRLSIACGVSSSEISAHKQDQYLATAWWSAHIADHLIRTYGFAIQKFLYLIQDYEPNFYPWGQPFSDATASYDLDFYPVFNTTLLRDYFAEQGHSFAVKDALAFHPSIDISRYQEGTRTNPGTTTDGGPPRKLALYGRPEVERNMYSTAVEALSLFIQAESLGPKDIELISVGLRHRPVSLPRGVTLKSLGKLPWSAYPDFLLNTDLGLSLMYSPHPSHPPIEMAASGVRVVTNSFGPKDLSLLSPAILSAEPTAQALALALAQAWHAPPVTAQDRAISLASLGIPMDDMILKLLTHLTPLIKSQP